MFCQDTNFLQTPSWRFIYMHCQNHHKTLPNGVRPKVNQRSHIYKRQDKFCAACAPKPRDWRKVVVMHKRVVVEHIQLIHSSPRHSILHQTTIWIPCTLQPLLYTTQSVSRIRHESYDRLAVPKTQHTQKRIVRQPLNKAQANTQSANERIHTQTIFLSLLFSFRSGNNI